MSRDILRGDFMPTPPSSSGGGSGGGNIGDTVTGGTTGSVLFVKSGPILGQDSGLQYTVGTGTLTATALVGGNVTSSALTSGRIPFATTAGLLTDASTLLFSGGTLTATALKATGLTSGRIPFAGTGGLLGDTSGFTFSTTTGQAITLSDTSAATQLTSLTFAHTTSATTTAGVGSSIDFTAPNDAGTQVAAGRIIAGLRSVTSTGAGAMVFQYGSSNTYATGGWISSGVLYGATLALGTIAVSTLTTTTLGTISVVGAMVTFASASSSQGGHSFTGVVNTSGARQFFVITPSANTASTLSTEIKKFEYAAYTNQWATGALTTQREVVWNAPTYAFVGASTITDAATVAITGAPIAGTNATITNSYSLWTQGGRVRHDGISVALGAGAAPTFGTIGGSGPATAAQNKWLEFTVDGTKYWVPAWV